MHIYTHTQFLFYFQIIVFNLAGRRGSVIIAIAGLRLYKGKKIFLLLHVTTFLPVLTSTGITALFSLPNFLTPPWKHATYVASYMPASLFHQCAIDSYNGVEFWTPQPVFSWKFAASVSHLTKGLCPKGLFLPHLFCGSNKRYYLSLLQPHKKKKSTMEVQLYSLFSVAKSVVHYGNLPVTHFGSSFSVTVFEI